MKKSWHTWFSVLSNTQLNKCHTSNVKHRSEPPIDHVTPPTSSTTQTCVCVFVCAHTCIHTYIYIERERERLVPSHTSGSICLGNREVVRYLYKILMSSCSNPLLKHRKSMVLKVWDWSSVFPSLYEKVRLFFTLYQEGDELHLSPGTRTLPWPVKGHYCVVLHFLCHSK